jgi:menaquinone-specific isochorismate synthase
VYAEHGSQERGTLRLRRDPFGPSCDRSTVCECSSGELLDRRRLWCSVEASCDVIERLAKDRQLGRVRAHIDRVHKALSKEERALSPDLSKAKDFLARCMASVPAGRTLVATIEAPTGLPEAFLASTWLPHGALWVPHIGTAFATAGVAKRVVLDGKGRLNQLRNAIEHTFSTMDVFADTQSPPPTPRFFGGLAFAEGAGDEPPWKEFGDGAFVLPRWCYALSDDKAFLMLAIGADQPRDTAAVFDELEAIISGIAGTGLSMWAPTISTSLVGQMEIERWVAMLANVRERLTRGELLKVVMARRSDVPIPSKLKDVTMLVRLRREIPECTRFAFRGTSSTFLGATPELLFSKVGSRVHTEALAGSIRCTGTDVLRLNEQNDRLLKSEKDLKEHGLVVRQIVERLRPFFSDEPQVPTPTTRRFRNIIHLHTPIVGHLSSNTDAVALLEGLHPTPAVGGVPAIEAARCILEVEPCKRGWYAGPVGWIDQHGDATFCVAIRSGLLAHPTAYIYAGAGIIAESDPMAEYSETGLKQMPMLLALGVDSVSLRATMAPLSRPDE